MPAALCGSPTLVKNLNQTYFKPAMSEIKFGKMRFLITDRPSEFVLDTFIKELQRNRVKTVVRVCEPTYSSDLLKTYGIEVKDWEYADGSPPPEVVIENTPPPANRSSAAQIIQVSPLPANNYEKAIAVHCVSGLGRAPVLVGIALLEAGMPWQDALFLIRTNRRGAFNEKQLEFLKNYKPAGKLRKLRYAANLDSKDRKSCAIM
uniref:protein-tyrosine-phosphatase n=1 Tax=Ditylenchus dipsaci TaxID=166011 RepID=A0A915DF18_9BILA